MGRRKRLGPQDALVLAIDAGGGVAEMARKLDVTHTAVGNWRRKRRTPAERVLAIVAAAGGAVTASDLRPDLYPRT